MRILNYTGCRITLMSKALSLRPLPRDTLSTVLEIDGFIGIDHNLAPHDGEVRTTEYFHQKDCLNTVPVRCYDQRATIEDSVVNLFTTGQRRQEPTDDDETGILVADVGTGLLLKIFGKYPGPIYACAQSISGTLEDDGSRPCYSVIRIQ